MIKKERRVDGLWLPFLYEIFGYLTAVAWSNLDFPAAEFFNFAANARSSAWDDEFSVLHFAFYAACFDKEAKKQNRTPKCLLIKASFGWNRYSQKPRNPKLTV